MPCTACERDDCEMTFSCIRCGETKNVCAHKVGGFDSEWAICIRCYEEMTLPVAVLAYIRRRFDRKVSVKEVV